MADFVEKTTVRTAVRELAVPIADVAAFSAIVQAVITDNPFGCVAYTEGGVSHQPVEKTKENYAAKIVYTDSTGKKRGSASHAFDSVAGYNAGIPAVTGVANLNTAHNGTPAHDEAKDTFSATLKCHDPNGEIYLVTLGRKSVSLASYSDDGIRTKIETWADSVPALA